jgi:hypothetical protein
MSFSHDLPLRCLCSARAGIRDTEHLATFYIDVFEMTMLHRRPSI